MKSDVTKSTKVVFAAVICIGLLAFFAGCSNGVTPDAVADSNSGGGGVKSSEKQLLEFALKAADNTVLAKDVIGTIDELSKTVCVIVPNGTDVKKLKPSFVLSSGARAFVKDAAQESGKTENDFTRLVRYGITAEDGSKQIYIVQVEAEPASGKFSGKKILTFDFKKDVNPLLLEDVSGLVGFSGGRGLIFIKFPAGTTEATIKSLKPTFTASAKAKLSIGGVKLENSKTAADFYNLTDGTNVTVTAENGDSNVYNVPVEIDLPKAPQNEVKKYFGSYYGTVPGLGEVIIVLEWNKVTLYSKSMSMDYVNVEWEKKADNTYTCTTYRMNKPQIKNLFGKGGYDFTESNENGKTKITVHTNIMATDTTAVKGEDFVWTAESGYKPVTIHI